MQQVTLSIALLNTGTRWFAVVDLTGMVASQTDQPFPLINAMQAKVVGFWQAPLVLAKRGPLGRWALEGDDVYKNFAAAHISDMEAGFHPVIFPLLP